MANGKLESAIDILLAEENFVIEGKQIAIVGEEVVDMLNNIFDANTVSEKQAKKLSEKSDQAKSRAQKFMKQVIKSHKVSYNHQTHLVGIAKSDTIYIGEKSRVAAAPDAEPIEGDTVKGKVTKYERRKYNELLENFQYLNSKINEHNAILKDNELKLGVFERSILANEEYDRDKQFLVVYPTGRILLCDRKN